MVQAVASSPDRVVCVVGPAGAGKTTATHAVAEAFQATGAPVLGAAPSGIAAERLQDETGIPSQTLHRLLAHARRSDGLPDGCVLIVDEAAMAETRVLAPILAAVEQAGGKAVLIGDPQQLPAVGAGGLFAAIVERHGAIELSENQRQRDELERRALAGGPGRARPRLPRLRRPTRPPGRLGRSAREPGAPARRLVAARPQRPGRQRDARSPPRRRRRAEHARTGADASGGPARRGAPDGRRTGVPRRRPDPLPA